MTALPHGWSEVALGELGDSIKGSFRPGGDQTFELYSVPSFAQGQPEILKASEIGSHKRPVEPGDVLVCKINPRINRVWVVGPCRDHPQLASPEWLVLRPPASANLSDALRFQLSGPQFRQWIETGVHGVTGSHTRAKDEHILAFPVRVPPSEEQGRIVVAIEEAFSKLNAGEMCLQAVRQRLTRMRSAVLGAAVTGVLVPQNQNESRADNFADWSSPKPDPFGDSPLADLPPSWSWVRAAAACDAVESGSTPQASRMTEATGDVPFIKVYNLTLRGVLDFSVNPTFIDRQTHLKQSRSAARPGDVLTNIVGPPLGKVAVVPDDFPEWNMNQAVVMFRPRTGLRSEFLAIALQTPQVLGRLSATARATAGQFNVSLTACRYLPLPIPPEAEQVRIVEEVQRQLSVLQACERAIEAGASRALALRRAVLKSAFDGLLVPQDPTDEPASVLLERIRDERAATPNAKSRRTGVKA